MKKNYSGFSRRGPDVVTEDLAAALCQKTPFEFKALFDVVHSSLKQRNAASGGEEMLRLRIYEKLQGLVEQGAVKKTITPNGKEYHGISAALQEKLAGAVLKN